MGIALRPVESRPELALGSEGRKTCQLGADDLQVLGIELPPARVSLVTGPSAGWLTSGREN